MSSVLSSYAQIPARSRFLFATASSNHGGFTNSTLVSQIAAKTYVIAFDGTILNTTDVGSFLGQMNGSAVPIAAGDLYRDMGKELHILQNDVKIAIFRYGQKVYDQPGNPSEGVGAAPNIWICTWQSQGHDCPNQFAMVKAVRTG